MANFTSDQIETVHIAMKNRYIHPEGEFDKGGRWYPSEAESVGLEGIRSPSKHWPYSYLTSCRTLKHVKIVAIESPELFAKHLAAAEYALSLVGNTAG
jgi:hypothetical protein